MMQDKLCKWYEENKRILPWRQTQDPYYIWVSEVMLQQTQVISVIPYYERFITRYPTVESLAYANEDDLIHYWQGLGYYQRARNLKKGALQIAQIWGGKLPKTVDDLLTISGIGPYTAGAIASIAYQQKAPAVDGNVFRVLSRYFGIDLDISEMKTRTYFEERVQELLINQDPSVFNQALMELGATICTKKNYLCKECPICEECYASNHLVVNEYPVKLKKVKQKEITYYCAIIISKHGLLLSKRKQRLLESFWHLPQVDCESESYFEQWLFEHYQINSPILKRVTAKHVFTHQKWFLNGFVIEVDEKEISLHKDEAWVCLDDDKQITVALAHLKLLNQI